MRPDPFFGLLAVPSLLALLVVWFASGFVSAQEAPPHPDGVLAREDPVVEAVGLADWPALDRALKRDAPPTGRIVSFRELWQADPKLADEPLLISGVVYRRFRTEARGQFPSLEELWIRTDDDGLAVVTNVVPPKSEKPEIDRTQPGSAVRLVAYFLRKIRYEAEDEPRIAPWLVSRGFESDSAASIGRGAKVPEAGNETLLLVILAVIGATTLLRLVLFWAERSRRSRRAEQLARQDERNRRDRSSVKGVGANRIGGPDGESREGGA